MPSIKIQDLTAMDKAELIELVGDLQAKLKSKEQKLHQTRLKLNHAKSRIRSMQDTVMHQRTRILELYKVER
jgi:hypothetical protein